MSANRPTKNILWRFHIKLQVTAFSIKATSASRCLRAICSLVIPLILQHPLLTEAQCVPTHANLVSWWPGDGSGDDVYGNNPAFIPVSGVTFTNGIVSSCFVFDGTKGYAQTTLDVQPSAMPSTTWEGWVFTTRLNFSTRQVLMGDDGGGHGRALTIESNTPNFGVFTGSGVWLPTDVSSNQWQHIAVVFSPTNILFYKNGVSYSYGSFPTNQGASYGFTFGRDASGSQPFQGMIDEVSVYGRALSTEEIQSIYAAGAFGKCHPTNATGVITSTDGPWNQRFVALTNTPEAAFMARVGDINNLGIGWPSGFNPFSGNSTPKHPYPWQPSPNEPAGTDRIMVVSSYSGAPPCGHDGYSGDTRPPANLPEAITLAYNVPGGLDVTQAVFQMFVDDFQAPKWCASYQVLINNKRANFLETIINDLVQTGPIGRLITAQVPQQFLGDVASGQLVFHFDDPTTGAGDGYAIDFIKLLVDPGVLAQTGTITGLVTSASNRAPISLASVTASSVGTVKTSTNGLFSLTNLAAGLNVLSVSAFGYARFVTNVNLVGGQTLDVNVSLVAVPAIYLNSVALRSGIVNLTFSASLITNFALLHAEQALGPWSTNTSAVIVTNAPGISYQYIFPAGSGVSEFYRVRSVP